VTYKELLIVVFPYSRPV